MTTKKKAARREPRGPWQSWPSASRRKPRLFRLLVQHVLDRLLLAAEVCNLECRLLFQHVLTVEFRHLLVFGRVDARLLLLGAQLLLPRVLGAAQLVEVRLLPLGDCFRIEDQVVLAARQLDLLAAGVDLVTAVLVVPLGERRR